MNTTADAVVIGGGVMGCSIMYNLAERGMADAVLLERGALGSGSTGRTVGILRTHYSNEVTTRMAWESLRVLRDFEQVVGGPSGYVRTGYLLIAGEKDRQAMEENVTMQRQVGVNTEMVSSEAVSEISPVVSMSGDEVCAYEPESGYADAHSVTHGYANRAREMGAEIRVDAPVSAIETGNGRVTGVVTPTGRVSTPVVVVATGPWSRPFLHRVGVDVPLETVRHQVVMLERPVLDHPGIGDLVNSLSARPDGRNMTLVGAGEEERAGPETYNKGVDMDVVETASAALAARIPLMSQARYRGGWSGLFTTTPDWHPILDRAEEIEGLYLALGFSGHGFKLAPMIGVVMAEMVTQGRATSIDVSMLGLGRFKEKRLLGSRYGLAVLA